MKNRFRQSLLLLAVSLVGVMAFANAQESATDSHTQVAKVDSTEDLLQKYKHISALPMPDRRNFFRNASATDKSNLWKVHLALYLVERPQLNEEQKQIILDAISLAGPEFFATTNNEPGRKTKVDEPLQLLTQRALSAFPKNEAAEVFANMGDGRAQDDLLQRYKDISALPMKKRRASFRKDSAKVRSDLWKTHMALSLVNRPELNEGQKEVILLAMSLATPEWLEVRSDSPAWKAKDEELRSLESRILTVFSREEGAKIFARLGDTEPVASGVNRGVNRRGWVVPNSVESVKSSDSSRYNVSTLNRLVGQEQMEMVIGGDCDCYSNGYNWCWLYCGGGPCNYSSSGCGTLWQYPCTGNCR